MDKEKTKKIILIILIILLSISLITAVVFILENIRKTEPSQTKEVIENEINATTELYEDELVKPVNEEQIVLNDAYILFGHASYMYWGNERYYKVKVYPDVVKDEETGEERYLNEIVNFNEVMNTYFTEKGREQFKNTVTSMLIKDGKAYEAGEGRAEDPTYCGTELILENEEDGRMEYIAKSRYIDKEAIEEEEGTEIDYSKYSEEDYYFEERPFIIVYDGEKWRIEAFTLPN